jgi:ferredoxin-NADP reductase/predicted pyridoxine 5'-phosphate oxidase superfamily flavin-nucleotide-binding protein
MMMAPQYAKIAFTKSVRQVQEEQNSRAGYAGMDTGEDYNFLLSQGESDFIESRDSFYMASVSETDWPYVQHRGGPKGFLKVIDGNTLGFADYKGNRQYISTGNFRTNDKVSIILMDYANRRRLKIIGYISQVEEDDWDKLASLEDDHYRARVERAFIIKIAAFDWNCPQHITPRYSETEISSLIEPLEEKIKQLTEQASHQQNKQANEVALGNGELPLVIAGIRQLTPDIRAYELRSPTGESLPKITAGSHIQVPISLVNNELKSTEKAWRTYSISSNPNRTDCYEISVKSEKNGKGGSLAVHQQYQLGLILHCKEPQNFFTLDSLDNNQHVVLIAGGIGITPIKSMALALIKQKKQTFELHYAGRNIDDMAYTDRLTRQLGDKLHLYPSQAGIKLSIKKLLSEQKHDTKFYFCGPTSMLKELKQCAIELGIESDNIHYEQFSVQPNEEAKACQITLNKSNIKIDVASDQTLLDAILDAGVAVPFSCTSGLCKSCVVDVSPSSNIQHLDNCLTDQERKSGKMCLCVSRPQTNNLIIDL